MSQADSPYHADILLVTAAQIETLAVFKQFHQRTRYFIEGKAYYDLGEVGGASVFLVQSEIGSAGPGGSFTTVARGIELLSPSVVIMLGLGYGLRPHKQQIGDILVSRQVIGLENIAHGPAGNSVILTGGDKVSASPQLIDRCRAEALEWTLAGEQSQVHIGLLASGEKLINSYDFRDQLLALEPAIIGGDMEGVGVYSAAQIHKVDWIIIRAIVDWGDGAKHLNIQEDYTLAAENAIRFTIQVLQQGEWRNKKSQSQTQNPETRQEILFDPAIIREDLDHKRRDNNYDIFLSYNNKDRGEVRKIYNALLEHNILPWFDEMEVKPGLPWQRQLEQQISTIKSAAIFVGQGNTGPWQNLETDALLREFVRRGSPVIPVLLPNAPAEVKLPLFLEFIQYVDFRKSEPDPLTQLISGVPSEPSIDASLLPTKDDVLTDTTEIRLAINYRLYQHYELLAPALGRRLGATNIRSIHNTGLVNYTVWEILLPPLPLRLDSGKAILYLRTGREALDYDLLIGLKQTSYADFLIIVDYLDGRKSPLNIHNGVIWLNPQLLEELVSMSTEDVLPWLGRLITSQVKRFDDLIPYRTTGSTDPIIFFGRDDEMDLLIKGLPLGGILVGAHKSGKTSLLVHLATRLRRDGYRVGGPYTIRSESINVFLLDTLKELNIDRPATIDIDTWSSLLVAQSQPGKPLVLLLDEIDELLKTDANNGDHLGRAMRALQYNGHCRFYLAGHKTLREVSKLEGKPFRNFAEEITLRGLSERAALQLIQEPIKALGYNISEEQAQQIFEGTAGIAVLIQEFCRRLLLKIHSHHVRDPDITNTLLRKIERGDYLNVVYEYFQYARTPGSMAITVIVSGLEKATRKEIIDELRKYSIPLNWQMLEDYLDFLREFGVLEEYEHGHFRILAKFLREAISTRYGDKNPFLDDLKKSQLEA